MQYCFSIAKLNMEISGSGQFEILIYYHLEKNHGGSEKGRNQPISCLSAITITLADHYLTKEPVGTKLACSRRSVSKRKHDSKQSLEKRRRRRTSAVLSPPAQGFPCSVEWQSVQIKDRLAQSSEGVSTGTTIDSRTRETCHHR